MSLSIDGFWKSGFWSETFWADGFWYEGDPIVTTTSQIGGGVSTSTKYLSERERKRLLKLKWQQGYFKDEEEILALILAEITRR